MADVNPPQVLAKNKSLPAFSEVSGDITPAFIPDTSKTPLTVNGSPLGSPAVSQIPYARNYPNIFDDYYAQHKDDNPPQTVRDILEFAKLINLKST